MSHVKFSEIKHVARRSLSRTKSHLKRVSRSILSAGPGRIPGQILEIRLFPDAVQIVGWAALPHGSIRAVLIAVDGVICAQATTGIATPVAEAGTQATAWGATAGWTVDLDRASIGRLTFAVSAVLVLEGGLTEDLVGERSVVLPTVQQIGSLDLPLPEARSCDRVVNLSGWFRSGLGYDHLDILIDDVFFVRARILSIPRPDLEEHIADSDAALAGWQATIEMPGEYGAEFVVTALAVGAEGQEIIGQRVLCLSERSAEPTLDSARVAVLQCRSAAIAGRERDTARIPHILIATHHLGLGGGQLYLHEVLKVMLATGSVKCTVLAMHDGVLRDELEDLGAEVQIVGFAPSQSVEFEQWMYQLVSLVSLTDINFAIANTLGSFWGVELASRLGIPSIWAIHESFSPEVFLRIGFGVQPDLGVRSAFLRAFDLVDVAVFEADATRAMFDHVVRPERGVRVDYGIDLDSIATAKAILDRTATRARLGIAPEEIVILCIGTYEPRKAQGLLALAFEQIAVDFPKAVLAMVGDFDGPYSHAVHRVVDNLESGERIRLIAMTPDIDEWYVSADAFILASDIESLPRSMLEAMAFGLPVLGTNVFGVPELIQDGVNGMLFEPSSVHDAQIVLRRFLTLSTEERHVLGLAGMESVLTTRSSIIYAHEYLKLIEALLVDRSAMPKEVLGR
ncbi:glycosyltransferase [Cryobacterium sp. Hh11]|uniref:glycosyltransferase family 4 protein n=1 Tax=Cryobacterium sp. Hh11 TaxID=2555868 RepID=UPI00106CE777|nr:glycosyltransferase family 4 protein [Cryobacterium sp. Hh11]TFD54764.1 glycosyltransferase [Cryobacterium sp. Hh11]